MRIKERWQFFKYDKLKGIRSLEDVLAHLSFTVWRWYFTRYRLPKLLDKSLIQLKKEYREYCQGAWGRGMVAMSFEDWCGTR